MNFLLKNFKVELIGTCNSRDEALSLETYYIKLYDTTNPEVGYNQISELFVGIDNPKAKLNDDIVLEIRKLRFSNTCKASIAYLKYKDIMPFPTFEKIWEGTSWRHIGKEFLNPSYSKVHKSNSGMKNGNALYSDEEVLKIRKFYVNHSLTETYNKFGNKSKTKDSFRSLIANSYKHLPIYSKIKKNWFLDNNIIDINIYTIPVSTISESGE